MERGLGDHIFTDVGGSRSLGEREVMALVETDCTWKQPRSSREEDCGLELK